MPVAANVVVPVTPNVPVMFTLLSNCAELVTSTNCPVFAVKVKLVFEVVPVIVLPLNVMSGSVNVPLLVIDPELTVPLVVKLPPVCPIAPATVSVPVMPVAANVVAPVTPNVPVTLKF